MNHNRIALSLVTALLLAAPATQALYWGVGGNIHIYPDDDHLIILVSAATSCSEYGARAAASAYSSTGGQSAYAWASGPSGSSTSNHYPGTHSTSANSNYDHEGPNHADANAHSGSKFYWASCTYPGDHTHGGGGIINTPIDDATTVLCNATPGSGSSKFVGNFATDLAGNTVLVGDRDGQSVVLPLTLDYGTAPLKRVDALADLEVSNVEVEANFSPDACDVRVTA